MRRSHSVLAAPILILFGLSACSQDPRVASQKFLASGDGFAAAGKPADAIIEYRNAVRVEPLSRAAYEKLADASLQSGDVRTAVDAYVRAADLAPGDSVLQVKVGNVLLLAGRFDEAKGRAEKALALDGRNVDAQILAANSLARLKNVDAAVAQIEDALRVDPVRSSTYSTLGLIELGRGKRDAAEQAFRKAVELDGASVGPQMALANFYWSTGRLTAAEEAFNRALAAEPRNVLTNRALASFYVSTKRLAEAEQPLKTVFEATNSPDAALALSEFYMATKNDEAARRVLMPLLNDPRASDKANLRLAALDYSSGAHAEALEKLSAVLERDQTNLDALLLQSAIALSDGKADEALVSAGFATKRHPTSSSAFFVLGRIQAALKRPDEAVRAFEEVLKLNPRATAAKVALAQLHLAGGRSEASLDLAAEAHKSEPDNADAQFVYLRGLLRRGQLDRAAAELKQMAARFPRSSAVHAEIGMMLGLKHEYGAARTAFDQALQLQPDNIAALDGLVALDLAAGNHAAARARLDARIASAPTSALLTLAARTYGATGDLAGAETLLRRALDLDSGNLTAYGGLGQLFATRGKLPHARVEFQKLTERSPRSVPALTMLAIIHEGEGNLKAAREILARVLEIDPEAPVAANNLAWIYATSGENLDVALQLAQTAQKHLPELAAVNDTLGFIYYRKNLPALAIPMLSMSVKKEPGNAIYQYHLGLALAGGGNREQARQALTRALVLKPGFDGAAQARALLTSLEK